MPTWSPSMRIYFESDCESPEVVTRWVRTLQLIPLFMPTHDALLVLRVDGALEVGWGWGSGASTRGADIYLHCKNIMVISTLAKVTSVALYDGFVIIMAA